MDLRTHWEVIWRFRVVAACGLVLALALTFLSVYRVSFTHGLSVSARQGQTWQSTEELLLASEVCPSCPPSSTGGPPTSLYAQIANSALVRTKVLPNGRATPASGDYLVSPVTDPSANNQALPLLDVDGTGRSAARAAYVARRAAQAFIDYLATASKPLRPSQRFIAQIVTPATAADAKVISSRKLTIPIFIFLAAMVAILGLIYLLENLRPRADVVLARPEGIPEPEVEALEPLEAQSRAESEPKTEPHLEALNPSEAQPRSEARRRRSAAGVETTRRRT